jgi:hypothetical protein
MLGIACPTLNKQVDICGDTLHCDEVPGDAAPAVNPHVHLLAENALLEDVGVTLKYLQEHFNFPGAVRHGQVRVLTQAQVAGVGPAFSPGNQLEPSHLKQVNVNSH